MQNLHEKKSSTKFGGGDKIQWSTFHHQYRYVENEYMHENRNSEAYKKEDPRDEKKEVAHRGHPGRHEIDMSQSSSKKGRGTNN